MQFTMSGACGKSVNIKQKMHTQIPSKCHQKTIATFKIYKATTTKTKKAADKRFE